MKKFQQWWVHNFSRGGLVILRNVANLNTEDDFVDATSGTKKNSYYGTSGDVNFIAVCLRYKKKVGNKIERFTRTKKEVLNLAWEQGGTKIFRLNQEVVDAKGIPMYHNSGKHCEKDGKEMENLWWGARGTKEIV